MWTKFTQLINGWKTIIFARFLVVVGLLVTILAAIDPAMVMSLVPPTYAPFAPLVLVLIGGVNEWLRRLTVAPVGVKTTTVSVDPGPPTTVSTSDNA